MPRQDVSEERKAQILDAAAIVFSQQGFASARMDDIVQQSGLSKGALYWYFKSKDEIISALMYRFFSQDLEEFNAIFSSDQSARAILLQYVEQLASSYETMEPLLPLMYDYYASATREEDKKEFFYNYFQEYRTIMKQVVQRGIDDGEFVTIDIDSFVVTLIALIEGLLLMTTIDVNTVDLSQQTRKSVTLLLDSIQSS